jgi:hypothetical protein
VPASIRAGIQRTCWYNLNFGLLTGILFFWVIGFSECQIVLIICNIAKLILRVKSFLKKYAAGAPPIPYSPFPQTSQHAHRRAPHFPMKKFPHHCPDCPKPTPYEEMKRTLSRQLPRYDAPHWDALLLLLTWYTIN